jgi:C4-dicarboxylate-binding protein DctP
MKTRWLVALALALAAMLVAVPGCGHSDKAGGVTAPAVLRFLATAPYPFGDDFAAEVRKLSHGRMRVEVTHAGFKDLTADRDVRFARWIVAGRYDLGGVSAEAWPQLGVKSFEPFELPFLVSDQSLLKAVLESPVPARMLKGLSARGVVGLAVMPGLLRHPIGYSGPVTAPVDFRGKGMHVPVSGLGDDLASTLGATPVHLPPGGSPERTKLLRSHRLDVDAGTIYGPPDAWFTVNETLSAPVGTLVANGKSLARLSADQRQVLRTAASHVAARALALVLDKFSEASGAVRHCDVARVINASPADVAALERVTRPLYAQLERDPQLRDLIAAIQAIKARTRPDPAPKLPASCSRPVAPTRGQVLSPSLLNGTYRWRVDRQTLTMTLLGGRWRISETGDHGTYKIAGDRILLHFVGPDTNFTLTFKRRPDGTLDMRPVPPMAPEDRHVLASAPWKRVGPPVASVR